MTVLEQILAAEDTEAWTKYLSECQINMACHAQLKATQAGLTVMARLAGKRVQHLDGELRHPDLWR